MALPLPKVVADVGPGGGVVTAMRGMNALNQEQLESVIKSVQAKYAPLTTQADAASKLAYANLMGPQFLAKLMGNQDILANIPADQRSNALALLLKAGSGQGTGAGLLNSLNQNQNQAQPPSSPLSNLVSGIKNAFGFGQPQPQPQPPVPAQQNPFAVNAPNLSQQDQNAIAGLQPGQSYVVQGNQPQVAQSTPPVGQNTFAENVGTYQGIKSEGQKAGEIRAKAIGDFGDEYRGALNVGKVYDNLSSIVTSPQWREMRNKFPLFQRMQLKALSKVGTPQQQQMIGDFITSAQEVVRDTLNSFTGTRLKGELGISQNMKISDDDTVDVALGKLAAAQTFNELRKQYSSITPQLMKDQHIDQQQALELADKVINPKKIKEQVVDNLNPKITIKNKKTGETMTVPLSEARRLGVPNV